MNLETLKPAEGAVKNNKRLGRGHGSGGGGTARRGHKGAKSRSGYSRKLGFEGGQMPLQRRLPKFGFTPRNKVEYKAINLDVIQNLIDATGTKEIDLGFLYQRGLAGKTDLVKVLGGGAITSAITIKVNAFSKSAKEAIEKAGGKTEVVSDFNGESLKEADQAKSSVAKTVKPKNSATTKKGDDLRKVEGIGPKITELFNAAGIITFADLAATKVEKLEEILAEAGSNYSSHNPSTWPEQAALAAAGKWDELKELQDKLDGGRPE